MDPQLLAIRRAQKERYEAQKKASEGAPKAASEEASTTSEGPASSGTAMERILSSAKASSKRLLEGIPPELLNAPISSLLADGPAAFPEAIQLCVELLWRVGDNLNAIIEPYMALLFHLWQLCDLDADVALFKSFFESLAVSKKLLLGDVFPFGLVDERLKACHPVIKLKFILAGEI